MAHIFTPALRRPLSKPFARSGTRPLIQRAISSLRARGTDAHLWLPGGDVKTYGPELVTNGTFDANINGWTAQYTSTANWQAGALRSVSSGINAGACSYPITCVVNKGYKLAGNILGGSHTGRFSVSASATLADPVFSSAYSTPATPVTGYFVATATTMYVGAELGSGVLGAYNDFDNISVREITSITPTITNGLTTGNYLESTGNTLATVDNPTGLVLDALGSVGSELTPIANMLAGVTGVSKVGDAFVFDGVTPIGSGNFLAYRSPAVTAVIGATYQYTFTLTGNTVSGSVIPTVDGGSSTGAAQSVAGTYTGFIVATTSNSTFGILRGGSSAAISGGISAISFKLVSGIHLTQSTTANKGLLKQDAGSRYYWLFDATDLLTGTFPAGYESVTVIDAKSTGQVTTSAANVVGSYSIGPSYSSYGRIIIKGSITASELALYQGFANRLAGL